MKVLVVEDDSDISELLTLYFEAKGYEVETAHDGQEALTQLQRVLPDLMLLDVVLPKLDGWSVLTAVRAQSRIPVILLTSLDDTDDVIKGLSLGAGMHGEAFRVELDVFCESLFTEDLAHVHVIGLHMHRRRGRVQRIW